MFLRYKVLYVQHKNRSPQHFVLQKYPVHEISIHGVLEESVGQNMCLCNVQFFFKHVYSFFTCQESCQFVDCFVFTTYLFKKKRKPSSERYLVAVDDFQSLSLWLCTVAVWRQPLSITCGKVHNYKVSIAFTPALDFTYRQIIRYITSCLFNPL